MLTIYLRENRTKNWAVALPKIQVMKNARFHSGIKRSPYEALFGSKIGEQLQPDYSELECDEESDESNSSFKILDGTHWLDVDRNIGLEMDEQIASNPAEQLSSVIAEEEVLNLQHFQREIEREGARVSQQLQATQMIEKSNKRLADVDVGDSIRVSVPDVDRSKVDHRNILGIVLEVEEGFYKIGTKNGILKQSFSRNQFERCNVKFLDKSDVPNTEVALRSAVGLSSSSGSTQGLLQCNCVKCTTNKCSCKKAGRLCNSRCHSSRDCHNK